MTFFTIQGKLNGDIKVWKLNQKIIKQRNKWNKNI